MFIIQKKLKFLFFIICFSIFSSISQTNEDIPFNNIATHKNPKPITAVIFEDFSGNEVSLKDYYGKLLIINFWATWCAPCKKEMPSLEKLQQNYPDIKIYPINTEKPNKLRTRDFYNSIGVVSLDIYFDPEFKLVKMLKMRGLPTSILINKNGKEFARVVGEIDYSDKEFIKFLNKYN